MHERTRRAVARLLFVLVCALPTFVTMFVLLVTFTPWFANYRRFVLETELSRRIGLKVQIEAVEYPAPATVRLSGVRLLEPETGAEVAKVRMVTWVTTPEKTAFYLSQPELHSAQLPFAWRVVHERFLCQPELTRLPVRMAVGDLTIHSQTGSMTLRKVNSWLQPVETGVEAILECIPAGRDDSAPVHVSVVRNRSGQLPTTDWTMNTGGVPLVCSAIADYFPMMRSLGSDATFMGTMRWKLSDAGWTIDLGGSSFDNIDLGSVMQGMTHRLTGQASIRLQNCKLVPGEDLDISGTIVAGAGFVSQSLLQELREHLNFDTAPPLEGGSREWPYETMAVRFDLFGSDMTLDGICNKQRGHESLPPGVVVAAGRHVLCASPGTRQSWVGLVRALWPERTDLLPVSTQTAWLFKLLTPPKPSALDEPFGTGQPRITATGELSSAPSISQP